MISPFSNFPGLPRYALRARRAREVFINDRGRIIVVLSRCFGFGQILLSAKIAQKDLWRDFKYLDLRFPFFVVSHRLLPFVANIECTFVREESNSMKKSLIGQ